MALFGQNNQQAASRGNDPFSRIADAEGQSGGIYPVPGVYPLLYVDVLKMKESRKGDDIFIAELDILKSDVASRPAGSSMSWVVNFRHDASPGNVKAFLAALMGVQQEEITGPDAAKACDEAENPCHGRLIRLQASNIQTKSGNDFTLCNWSPIGEEFQVKADELRKQAGFAPF